MNSRSFGRPAVTAAVGETDCEVQAVDRELFSLLAGSVGLVLAACALLLNAFQLRWLARGIRGNTYQLLAQHALEMQKVLLENDDIEYLYTASGLNRRQAIFDNILGNYIETMWIQRTQGLLDDETWQSFEGLLKRYATTHRHVFEIVRSSSNYAPKLQEHLDLLLARVDATTEGAGQ